ncbi:MAG: transposase [Candidatus Moranbacteria bacterium]|nr:transposase [Candidatus Moranbacteria bacterium]
MRKTQLVENEYYHIYNRGVDKRNVFLDDFDYIRFLKSIQEFNSKELVGSLYEKHLREKKNGSLASTMEAKLPNSMLVEIIAYCLNPNHYHFILKQLAEKGIEKFMQRLGTGYTKYFNQKYERTGSLFQGTFKAAQIKTNGLLYLSAYINCNAEVHGIAKAENYRWCSFQDYIGKRNGKLCNKEIVLDQFRNKKDYFDFSKENAKAMKEKKEFEKLLIE